MKCNCRCRWRQEALLAVAAADSKPLVAGGAHRLEAASSRRGNQLKATHRPGGRLEATRRRAAATTTADSKLLVVGARAHRLTVASIRRLGWAPVGGWDPPPPPRGSPASHWSDDPLSHRGDDYQNGNETGNDAKRERKRKHSLACLPEDRIVGQFPAKTKNDTMK